MNFFKTLLASTIGAFVAFFLITIIGIFVVVAIVASAADQVTKVGSSGSSSATPTVEITDGTILEFDIPSKFAEYSQSSSGLLSENTPISFYDWIQKIKSATTDSKVAGIWLKCDNFDANWAQAEELREQLLNFKSKKKFIIASGENFAEKSYFIASVADSIYISPSGQFEINGLFTSLEFYKPLLDKIGVTAQVTRAGKYKSAVEPFILNGASVESKEVMTTIIEQTYNRFTNVVCSSRDIPDYQLKEIIDNNSILNAVEAQGFNFFDAVKYKDEIMDLLRSKMKIPSNKNYLNDSEADDKKKLKLVKLRLYKADVNDDTEDKIALLYAVGNIQSGKSGYNPNPLFGGDALGSETFIEALKTARESKKVKGVLIRIDSPGGSAQASDNMWREIALTQAVKPVYVSMGGITASGGYYLAAGAEHIIADSSTLTGSIGVFSLWFNAKKLYSEKAGINVETIKSNPNADIMLPVHDLTPAQQTILSKNVDSVYAKFLNVVSQGRKLTIDSVQALAQGRVWTGLDAKNIGLVDELGSMDYAIDALAKRTKLRKYSLLILPKQKSFIEKINEALENTQESYMRLTKGMNSYIDFKHEVEILTKNSGIQARMNKVEIH